MYEQTAEIKAELELAKLELEARLGQVDKDDEYTLNNEKHMEIIHYVKEDLDDVNRALAKIDLGLYGLCESTGKRIPLDKLRIFPTVRTIDEVNYPNNYIH
ncbi:TraR/DksA family transcriptional regulator [Cytobacillus sp. Hm23]